MPSLGSRVMTPLERWSALVFLVAGVLGLLSSGINTLDTVPGVSTQHGTLLFIEGLAGFGGVVLSFVAILGLYPKVRPGSPGLAKLGLAVMVLPVAFFLFDLVWLALSGVLGLPSFTFTYLPSPMLALGGAFLLFALGTTAFGVIVIRTNVLRRPVGWLLLLFASAWYLLLGGIMVLGAPIPVWLLAVTGLLQGGPLLAIGYLLGSDRAVQTRSDAVAG